MNKTKAIIVDIDGTLAIKGDRSPYDWSKVGIDSCNEPIKKIVNLYPEYIIVVSGRDEICRAATEEWLKINGIKYHELHMRPNKNYEKDSVIKNRIYLDKIKPGYEIEFVLDDRNQVVEMWRNIGLTCLQVANGDF